jgi:hypothetical protein
MTPSVVAAWEPLGFDAFGVAVGLGVAVGALAFLVPALFSLTGALAALSVATWAARLPPQAWGRAEPRRSARATALALAGLAGGIYLAHLPALAPSRALLLGLGLVPLWWVERAVRPRPGARGATA